MDIQVRFEDGTTEMRGEHTVCWVDQVITQTREDPIGQHRGKTVWIPSAGKRGRVETDDAQGALDAMARDAGYKSHADACEATGEQTDDWTTDRYKFLGGGVSLLVTEVTES